MYIRKGQAKIKLRKTMKNIFFLKMFHLLFSKFPTKTNVLSRITKPWAKFNSSITKINWIKCLVFDTRKVSHVQNTSQRFPAYVCNARGMANILIITAIVSAIGIYRV